MEDHAPKSTTRRQIKDEQPDYARAFLKLLNIPIGIHITYVLQLRRILTVQIVYKLIRKQSLTTTGQCRFGIGE